jgi:large subunit ribosomal protein L5
MAKEEKVKTEKSEKKEKKAKQPAVEPRLYTHYKQTVKALQTELGLKNANQVPKLTKIVVNIGQGDATQNIKNLEAAVRDLTQITGQKPVMTRAKKSIATFKLRKGLAIGCCVTLRGAKMYEFMDRLVNIAVPRIRDFRGFSPKAFDGRGNYSLGIKEQIIFPEIEYEKVDKVRGMGITFAMSAANDVQAKALLEKFNFPFRK